MIAPALVLTDNKQKIVVFGATGQVGKAVTDVLLTQGKFIVNAVSRNPGKLGLNHAFVRPMQGDTSIQEDVDKAVEGCVAVVVTIQGNGQPGKPSNSIATAASTVIPACKKYGVKKVILIAGAAALESAPGKYLYEQPGLDQFADICKDHINALALYNSSDLDFTMVCMPLVKSQPFTGKYNVASEAVPQVNKWTIGDYEVADFVLKEIQNPQYHRVRIGISDTD